jgi:hypothetical protein
MFMWACDAAMRSARNVASLAVLAAILIWRLAGKARKTSRSFFAMVLLLKRYIHLSKVQDPPAISNLYPHKIPVRSYLLGLVDQHKV